MKSPLVALICGLALAGCEGDVVLGDDVGVVEDGGSSDGATNRDGSRSDAGARQDAQAIDAESIDGGRIEDAGAPRVDGGFQANCIDSPSACGYPDETNTGVPAGVSLTRSGSITVRENGAVIENLDLEGQVMIRANNVTIRNSRITSCDYYPIDYPEGEYFGLVVEDSEIASTCSTVTAGLSFGDFTAIRLNVHGAADGLKANRNSIIEDCYIHDLAVSPGSHNDGVQTTGGDDVVFRHNTCDTESAGVCIQFGGSNANWLVTDNLIHAGGWALNGNENTTNSTFTNNRFVLVSGWYGPASLVGDGITWSGNYYDHDGSVTDL